MPLLFRCDLTSSKPAMMGVEGGGGGSICIVGNKPFHSVRPRRPSSFFDAIATAGEIAFPRRQEECLRGVIHPST
jgi:hypothetical protein